MTNRRSLHALLAVLLLTLGSVFAFASELVIAGSSEITNFDPRLSTDVYSAQRSNIMMEPLVVFGADPLELQPRLAESWEISEDLQTITFHLREGVLFHDGEPFTSADVKYTFETVLDEDFGAPNRSLYVAIESIDTPDDHTVVFNLNRPHAFLINNLARMPIVPAHADEDTFANEPFGTGPYKFESFVRDDVTTFTRFDDYWGGADGVERVVIRVIPNAEARLLAFESGEIDLYQEQIPGIHLDRLRSSDDYGYAETAGTGYSYVGFNTRAEPFDNKLVRQAVSHLINREAIVDRIYNGNAIVGSSMLLPTMPWYDPDTKVYDYNPERAKELLDEAGVSFDKPFRISASENSTENILIAEILQQEFAALGIEATVDIEEFSAYLARIQQTEDKELFILGWSGQLDPDRAMIRQFHSGEFGTSNYTYYANERVDELLELGAATDPTSQESIDIYREAAEIIVDEASYAFINYRVETALWQNGITGYTVHPYSPASYQDVHLIRKGQ